jgi:hypothetical protein
MMNPNRLNVSRVILVLGGFLAYSILPWDVLQN